MILKKGKQEKKLWTTIILSDIELEVLKYLLEFSDVEDVARESLEDKDWTKGQFDAYNSLRRRVGLELLEPYEEED